MKHLSLLPCQLIHHQYDHPHLMITQPQLTEYRIMPTTVGQQRIHITLDRTTSGFRKQLHLGVTMGNRSFTNRLMNKLPHQLSWKKFGSKKGTRELLTIHTTVITILFYRTVTGLKCHSIPVKFVVTPLHNLKDRVSEYFPMYKTTTIGYTKQS